MKLRPRHRVVIDSEETRSATTLLARHVHAGGENTPYMCSVCLTVLRYRAVPPAWAQCSVCHNVFHEKCILAHIQQNAYEDTNTMCFSCPMCKHPHTMDDFDDGAWYPGELISDLDDDDVPYGPVPNSSDRRLRSSTRSAGCA